MCRLVLGQGQHQRFVSCRLGTVEQRVFLDRLIDWDTVAAATAAVEANNSIKSQILGNIINSHFLYIPLVPYFRLLVLYSYTMSYLLGMLLSSYLWPWPRYWPPKFPKHWNVAWIVKMGQMQRINIPTETSKPQLYYWRGGFLFFKWVLNSHMPVHEVNFWSLSLPKLTLNGQNPYCFSVQKCILGLANYHHTWTKETLSTKKMS